MSILLDAVLLVCQAAGLKGKTMELKRITPKLAKEWLQVSTAWAKEHPEEKNRNISAIRVRRLVAAIRAGEWQVTNQGIMIGAGGIIVDGQHRLSAIAEAGIACDCYVLQRDDITSPRHVPVDIDGASRSKYWVLGLRRDDWEIANMMVEFAGSSNVQSRLSYRLAVPAASMTDLSEYVGQIGLTQTKTRLYAQVPVRVGAVLAWVGQAVAVKQYAALINQDFNELWPIVASLGSQLNEAALKGRRIDRREVLIRSFKAFSAPEDRRRKRLQIGPKDAILAHKAACQLLDEVGVKIP